MIHDQTIDRAIGKKLLAENSEREAKRTPSGKLSASQLGNPLQWQILKYLGVPQKEIDEYTIRKFLRGNQIEDWLVSQMDAKETQKFVEYRNAVGYIDAVVDTEKWEFPRGVIPCEVKSITNAKYRRLMKEKAPQRNHTLQAGFYALAMGSEWYAISYVASDDLRVETFMLPVREVKDEIEQAITDYEKAIEAKVIPVFQAKEGWQEKPDYNNYPEWMNLTEDELKERSKELFANKINQ